MNVLHPKPSRAQKAIDLPSSPVGIIKDLEAPVMLGHLKNSNEVILRFQVTGKVSNKQSSLEIVNW